MSVSRQQPSFHYNLDMVTTRWYGSRGEFDPDPFTYDPSKEARGKLCYLLDATLRELSRNRSYHNDDESHAPDFFRALETRIKHAFGFPGIPNYGAFVWPYQSFLYGVPDSKSCIKALEVMLNTMSGWFLLYADAIRNAASWDTVRGAYSPTAALARLLGDVNQIFRLDGCGYQAEVSDSEPRVKILRTDSEFLHQETVRRPLALLRQVAFENAAKQFEEAVQEWGEGNHADAITDANAAFESTMKLILNRNSGQARDLIRDLVKRGFLPGYLETSAMQMADLFESLPRLRDNESDAHGKLTIDKERLPAYARLAINMAGSMIVYLVEEHERRATISAR
jgi:hypothetical protein